MSAISITKLYELLSSSMGKKVAENLTNFVEHKIKDELENKSQLFATKEDLLKTESKLELSIKDTKNEMIKWMFIFWIGQMSAILAILFMFLKK